MQNMPKYVLKIKRLSKTKTVVVFRRNYLNVKNFVKQDIGWVYEEKFEHYGIRCYFKIIVHSNDIYDMYSANSKILKVKGKHNSFGVFMRLPKQHPPFEELRTAGCVECILNCKGRNLAYDNGKGIGYKRTEKINSVSIHSYESRTPVSLPSSILWNASHPFQGGGFSPK